MTGAAADEAARLRHDIRNAIAALLAGLRLLERGALSPEQRDRLDGARAAAELTAGLAEELLRRGGGEAAAATRDAASIEAGIDALDRPEGRAGVGPDLPPTARAGRDDGLPDLSGLRVLVAEDDATQRALVAGLLGQMGATCAQASNGVEALNWLARERFDVALLDREMPILGGADVIAAERKRQARGLAPRMPMVVVSGEAGLAVEGADGVIAKPLPDARTFGRAIEAFARSGGDPTAWRPDDAAPFDVATLRDLLAAAGPDDADEVLDRLRSDLAGVEAALAAARDAPDRPSIALQSHTLVSLAGAVGAMPTLAQARALGALARGGEADDAVVRAGTDACLARVRALRAELLAVGQP